MPPSVTDSLLLRTRPHAGYPPAADSWPGVKTGG